ncbi:hypothetical protein PENTCL1PPCAC_4720, partial [Pristionchus entomophagus]
ITLLCIISSCFSILKLLACSIDGSVHSYPGVWILSLWSLVVSFLYVFLCRRQSSSTIVNEKSQKSSVEEIQLSRWRQISILLSYTLKDWPWLLLSLILTIASAAVSVMLPHYSSCLLNGLTKLGENNDLSSTIKIF